MSVTNSPKRVKDNRESADRRADRAALILQEKGNETLSDSEIARRVGYRSTAIVGRIRRDLTKTGHLRGDAAAFSPCHPYKVADPIFRNSMRMSGCVSADDSKPSNGESPVVAHKTDTVQPTAGEQKVVLSRIDAWHAVSSAIDQMQYEYASARETNEPAALEQAARALVQVCMHLTSVSGTLPALRFNCPECTAEVSVGQPEGGGPVKVTCYCCGEKLEAGVVRPKRRAK